GEVTHVNVLKGAGLYSVMYLSPKTVTRVLNGSPAIANSIDDISVQFYAKGKMVGEGTTKPQFQSGWWTSTTFTPIDGALLNKNQTPFAPLYWDRYEEIKPAH
ncbi:MAG TPA: Amuc_1102 family pilus-like protein, partial [Chthoniobacteraceae bacterium]|nr:Amuc_1102 family pilus-like protein [Chthoniobacteraceae bacterium]